MSKAIAILGITIYPLSTWLDFYNMKAGGSPDWVNIIIWALIYLFIIAATTNMWKISRATSVLFLIATLLPSALRVIRNLLPQDYEGLMIIPIALATILSFVMLILVIVKLLRHKRVAADRERKAI